MKMDFFSVLLMILCVCFAEINCKSIHVHDDFNSDFEVSEGNSLNHKHDSKSKVSWIKLKPILHREMQHVRYIKGTESTTLSAENTHPIPNNNEETSSKKLLLTENEEISYNGDTQNSINIIKTDIMKSSNLTIRRSGDSNMIQEIAPNNTNVETPKNDLLLNKNDFPYNITPDIMNQNGDLIVFLALNENGNKIDKLDYNETGLVNEGTTVTLEEISTTGLELLKDFETQGNLMDMKFSSKEKIFNDDNNLTNFKTDFNVDDLEMNRNEDKVELIEETSIMSEIFEINTERSEILNNEQTTEYLFRDDHHLELSSSENSFKDYKSDEKKSLPDSTLTSTQSDMNGLQANSDEKSNASDIALKRANIFQNINNEQDLIKSFKDDKLTKVSIKRESNSKCPDPGLCIFWFLALDTCEEDSHCFGSLICCTWGCSKMCMDVDGETP